LIVDIFNTASSDDHQFDLPFQFNGHLINTSFKYKANTDKLETLGNKNGYQFIWKEAEAKVENTTAQLTFLNDRSYYSISSLIDGSAKIFLTRTGANDPDFNLRHEPAMVIRKNGKSQSFINVIEIHGKFDPVYEFSSNAYPSVKQIKLLQQDENYTVAEVFLGDKKLIISQCNKDFDTKQVHSAANMSWTGPFMVMYNGKIL
jgi:hypothetical protein